MEIKGSPSKYPFLPLSPHWALDNLQSQVGVQGTHSIGVAIAVVTVELSAVFEKVDRAIRFGQLLIPLGCVAVMVGWWTTHQHFQGLLG